MKLWDTRFSDQPRPRFCWDQIGGSICILQEAPLYGKQDMDVGQNGRPRGPQMWMSSLVLTIQLLGVPNFDP